MSDALSSHEIAQPPQFSPTIIPDQSMVTSELSLLSQSVNIDYAELAPYFGWIKEQAQQLPPHELVKKAASLTINNVKPGDPKWEAIVKAGGDFEYTLGRCIAEKANSCFQRAIFFNLLMQEAGIRCATVSGHWVESTRQNILTENPKDLAKIIGGFKIAASDKEEAHVWNLAEIGGKVFLVDTAYLIDHEGKKEPVIQEVPYKSPTNGHWRKPEDRYYRITLPNGTIRHYAAEEMLQILQ